MYIFKNNKNEIIYVGKAKDLKKRVASYFAKTTGDPKTEVLRSNIDSLDFILTTSEIEAFLLEANLIKEYKPFFNLKMADDKFYPYVEISKDDIPCVSITRRKNNAKSTYFGPYPDANSLKAVLKIIRRIFPYQSVRNHPKRKCLYNHLNLCPCIPAFPENLSFYKKNIKNLEKFLDGKKDDVIKELEKEKEGYIKSEEFEKAGAIQKKIDMIKIITSENYDPFEYIKNPEFYQNRITSEQNSLKEILFKYYKTLDNINRIECYDISNIQGTNATGSMVVFMNGDASKSNYRRFKIYSKKTPDDYKMMQEVLTRRLKHLQDWGKPDLIVIDGGKGQVKAALEVLIKNDLNVPIIGLAKREETIIISEIAGNDIHLYAEKLPLSTPGLNLLRRLRDEAHRFAVTYHRKLRKKLLIR